MTSPDVLGWKMLWQVTTMPEVQETYQRALDTIVSRVVAAPEATLTFEQAQERALRVVGAMPFDEVVKIAYADLIDTERHHG